MANVHVVEILREIASIYQKAKDSGIQVPTHVDHKFKSRLYSTYRDRLILEGIDVENIGYVLGNKSRWKSEFCKFFTLHFMKFMMLNGPRTKFDPESLVEQYTNPDFRDPIWLNMYEASDFSPSFVMNGPNLFVQDSRTIAIKAKIEFPNVYKAKRARNRNQYMYKWVNMRYALRPTGTVSLLPFPKLEAKPVKGTNEYTTRGVISSLPGEIAKFSYCQLASTILALGKAGLKMLVSPNVDVLEFDQIRLLINLINLITNRSTQYYLIRPIAGTKAASVTQMSLFGEVEETDRIRLNGDEQSDYMYIYFGSPETVAELLEGRPIEFTAHRMSTLDLQVTNIYENLDEDEDLAILLFETYEEPNLFDTAHLASWHDGLPSSIKSHDILTEDELFDLVATY